jgi:hypothetical protein
MEKLQECFRSELSATETYQLALGRVTHVGLHRTLQEMLTSHARRQDLIADSILGLGGEPPTSSGVWGVFAKVFQAGADLLGDRPAIAALEEGEDRCLKLYTEGPDGCDRETRQLIDKHLLPAQQRTHDLCKTLRDYVTAPS